VHWGAAKGKSRTHNPNRVLRVREELLSGPGPCLCLTQMRSELRHHLLRLEDSIVPYCSAPLGVT